MARSVLFKFFALLLAATLLLTCLASGAAIIALAESGLYSMSPETLIEESQSSLRYFLANRIVCRYLAETEGNCPGDYLALEFGSFQYPFDQFDMDKVFYVITDEDGNTVDYKTGKFLASQTTEYQQVVATRYPIMTQYLELAELPDNYEGEWYHFTDTDGSQYAYRIAWAPSDQLYTVTFYLLPGAYQQTDAWAFDMLELGYSYRFQLIGLCLGSLLGFALVLICLCCVAAKKRKSDEIRPAGLNRLPLDLYAAAVGTAVVCLAMLGYELVCWNMDYFDPWWLMILLIGAMAYAGCLLIVCFLFACAAQFKTPDGFWYKHSFLGWCFRLAGKILRLCFGWLGRFFVWLGKLLKKLLPAAKRVWEFLVALADVICRKLGKLFRKICELLEKGAKALWHSFSRFVALLPLTWQWLLTAFFLLFIMLLTVNSHTTGLILLGFLTVMAIVFYGTHCFGTLLESTKRMSKGDLDTKVEDKLLLGSFKEYATHLNALADVAVEAARKQMKSERMKAELITNVSHDIKTPLTSIINYVDLLQKAETEEQSAEYLDVLDRQSQRLKKLIDDLMEMSKASTGNMAVDLTAVDPVEAVNQALGEFSDKLAAAELTPIFQYPEESLRMMADGRLAWRVLSNLLSNAVKYALPGTRLYIDIAKADNKILISLKNISREQLNVSSDELMERFVRGDASRNTEGSGLGLNIAQNLMELQKGKLQLLVDGDLFKATLFFPEA